MAVFRSLQLGDLLGVNRDPLRLEALLHVWRDPLLAIGTKDYIARPELHHQRQASTFVARPIDGEGLVAMLEAVTIRTMVDAPAIKGLDALKLWHEILQSCCQQDFAAPHRRSIGACDGKFVPPRRNLRHMARIQRDGLIATEFRSRGGIELPWRGTFLAEQATDLVRCRIPVLPIIVKPDPAAAPSKHERRTKTRRAPSHNDDIISFGQFPLPYLTCRKGATGSIPPALVRPQQGIGL